MNTANNQLHRETENRLREELLRSSNRSRNPRWVSSVKPPASTAPPFFRHYRDIPDLMEKIEKDIQKGLFRTVGSQGNFLEQLENSSDALEPLISYIGESRHFYRIYLRKHGGAALEDGYQLFWERKIQPLFLAHGVESEARMRYFFAYAKSGFVTVLRMWLEDGCRESPRELAGIIHKMLPAK